MGHSPTAEQRNARELFLAGGTLVIEAGAGTGKTSTMVYLAKGSPHRRGQYVAFNKAIVEDSKAKMPDSVRCHTAHGLAYRDVGKNYKARLDASKRLQSWEIAAILGLDEIAVTTWTDTKKTLSRTFLAGVVMKAINNYCMSADPEPTYRHMSLIPNLDAPPSPDRPRSYAVNNYVGKALEPAMRRAWKDLQLFEGSLRFEPGHYLKMWQLSKPRLRVDYVLFDEAQDASPVMSDVVLGQAEHGTQLVFVGDSCQPAGTLVTVVERVGRGKLPTLTTQVPIEELEVGDRVVSYDIAGSHLHLRGKPITGISSRDYDNYLIRATGPGVDTRYTLDHRVVTMIGDALAGKHVVYMMRRRDQYRIGKCLWRYGSQHNSSGPYARCRHEGADGFWVLSAHDSAADAILAEHLAAHRYGIPTLTFEPTRHAIDVHAFWREVGGNTRAAADCLADYGRLIAHPLWEKGTGNMLQRRPIVTRAANLMTGMRLLPLTEAIAAGGKQVTRRAWQAVSIEREPYLGKVYSMDVADHHTYVGDGVVTHNCQEIYAWAGAVNALAKVPADNRAYLSQSFRFGPAIADVANVILGALNAPLRLTGTATLPSTVGPVPEPHAILCRTNATAIRAVMSELEADRRPFLVGGLGELYSFVRAAGRLIAGERVEHPELACFESWAEVKQYVEEDEQGSDLRLWVGLIEDFGIARILAALDETVDEKDADVVISTAHKSKGREWETVRLADDFKDDPDEAELRLLYVAATRARLRLDITRVRYLEDTAVAA